MRSTPASLTVLMLLGLSAGDRVASAHLPIFDDGTAVNAEHALIISDISPSQVVYHEVQDVIASLPQDIARVRAFHESSATTAPCSLIPVAFIGLRPSVRFIGLRRNRQRVVGMKQMNPHLTSVHRKPRFLATKERS